MRQKPTNEMEKYRNIVGLFALTLLVSLSSCQERAVEAGQHIKQTALLYKVEGKNVSKADALRANRIEVEEETDQTSLEQSVAVGLSRPANQNARVYLRLDEAVAQYYIDHNLSGAELLPEGLVTLPEHLLVAKGASMSEATTFSVNLSQDLEPAVPYVFAISLDKAEPEEACVALSDYNKSLVYTLTKTPKGEVQIKSVLQLERDNYLEFISNPAPSTPYAAFTIETLVNVDKFHNAEDPGDSNISTLFGIENLALFRFGDSSVPGHRMQAIGTHIPFDFEPKRWYHFAAVFSGGKMAIYIDGKRISSDISAQVYLKKAGYDPWYIGRSYNEQRGIKAKLSEVRVWSVARSADELIASRYAVDEKSDGLMFYWKMDKAEGPVIKNLGSFGSRGDLIHKKQKNGSGSLPVEIIKLEDPVHIED